MREAILREPRKLALSALILAGMLFGWWLGLRVTQVAAPVTTLTVGWVALRLAGIVT